MKTLVVLQAAACAAALFLFPARSFATDPGVTSKPAKCDGVADAVTAEIKKDPRKVLLVVEDFMVSNQGCAAEIVKAAVLATNADAEMRKQIAITATHIAPDMAKAIEDSIAALAPAQAPEVVAAVQKEATGETTDNTQNQQTETSGDYTLPTDLRGVFFIEPLASGGVGVTTSSSTPSHSSSSSSGNEEAHHSATKTVVSNSTPHHPTALSPSSGAP